MDYVSGSRAWPSKAALRAGVGAATLLAERMPELGQFDGRARDELIARLRLFLETCPTVACRFSRRN